MRQRLESLYGKRLSKVILFGSQAREDADEGSDIDVLVVLTGMVEPSDEVSRTIRDVADLSLQNDTVVNCIFVSSDEYEEGQSPLMLNVRREGQAI